MINKLNIHTAADGLVVLPPANRFVPSLPSVVVSKVILTGEYLPVMCTGDSIADLGSSGTMGSFYLLNTKGWPAHTAALSNQLFKFLPDTGVAGNTTKQLLDRLQTDVIDSSPKLVIIMCGTNDVHAQIDEATTISNMQSIVNTLTAAGIKVLLTPITWRGDNHPNYTTKIERINTAYAEIASKSTNVAITDGFTEYNNLVVDTEKWDEVSTDRLHPLSPGAYLLGKVIADKLDEVVVSTPPRLTKLTTNPTFSGTSGSINLGATGTAPDDWSVFYAQPETGFGSEIRTVDGKRTVVLTAGHADNSNGTKARLFQTVSVSNADGTADFIATATVSVSKTNIDNALAISLGLRGNVGGAINFQWNGESTTSRAQNDLVKYKMITLPVKLTDATSAVLSLDVLSRGDSDVTVQIHELELTQVNYGLQEL